MDAVRRHLLGHKIGREPPKPTIAIRLDAKPYHTNPTSVNTYLYKQTMPKTKRLFHEYYKNLMPHHQKFQDHTT